MHLEIVFGHLEVLEWVLGDVDGINELSIIEGGDIDGLALSQAILELLDEANESHDAADHFLQVLVGIGLLESFDGLVEDYDGLALILEAGAELLEVKVATEALQDTLKNEGQISLSVVSHGEFALLTDEDLGGGFTNVEAKAIVVFWRLLIVFNRLLELLVDAVSMDHKVLANVDDG